MNSRLRAEDGVGAIEFVGAVVILLTMLMAMVYVGRTVTAGGELQSAVADALRAATLRQTQQDAEAMFTQVFTESINSRGALCRYDPATDVTLHLPTDPAFLGLPESLRPLQPGAYASATVSCQVVADDLGFAVQGVAATMPTDRRVVVSARERIDTFRGDLR